MIDVAALLGQTSNDINEDDPISFPSWPSSNDVKNKGEV